MAENNTQANEIQVNDLPTTSIISNNDTLMLVQDGISTKQVTVNDLSMQMLQATSVETLDTVNKKPIGAVNELAGKVEDLESRVADLEKSGTGLKKLQMNLIFADTSGNGE